MSSPNPYPPTPPLPPPLPEVSHDLRIPGFRLGHGSDPAGGTGATVILCPEGALAAAEVRGSATGTRQFDSLVLGHHVASRAHAVVLSGASSFGLRSADPVVEHLAAMGRGFDTGLGVVPLVPTAILFDLGFRDSTARPSTDLIRGAIASAADGRIAVGSVGAGTGATVGKSRGLPCCMKGGFGFASFNAEGGPTVAAAVAVNAFGDVRDEEGRPLAGCRAAPDSHELVGADRVLAALPGDAPHPWDGNTTLAAVLTDAALSKTALLKVCQMAFGGFHRALCPALSMVDGDLVMALTTGRVPAQVNQVGVLAELAILHAIAGGVRAADGFGVVPAVRDLGR